MIWLKRALSAVGSGEPCVLVTIAATKGSSPREPGAKMLVLAQDTVGSIGGGQLELDAIEEARRLLLTGSTDMRLARFALGPELEQCCGGIVRLWFEPLTASDLAWLERWSNELRDETGAVMVKRLSAGSRAKQIQTMAQWGSTAIPTEIRSAIASVQDAALVETRSPADSFLVEPVRAPFDRVYLFGAGHVGRALVQALAPLPFRVDWIDSRDAMFPATVPARIVPCLTPRPELEVERAAPQACFVVMTHSHPLDFEICERVLRRGDFAFLGLIGSATKRARLVSRLRMRGVPEPAIARLTCPIGIAGIRGKEPAVIAAAVAAQLLVVSAAVHRTIDASASSDDVARRRSGAR